MKNTILKPISSVFLQPLLKYAEREGIPEVDLLGDLWDRKSKWVETETWTLIASRLEQLSGDPLACYTAGFCWVSELLDNDFKHQIFNESNLIIGRTYTLRREYIGNGNLLITMEHAPGMEPPRNGVLFNLGGLNAIAQYNNPRGKAVLVESQCRVLPPLPGWHPPVGYGEADVFELI